MPTRDEALTLLHEWVENEGLINHMKAVEAAVRQYAREMVEHEETWGIAGLLHDLDWEKYPDEHPLRAVEELRARAYDGLIQLIELQLVKLSNPYQIRAAFVGVSAVFEASAECRK